MRKENVISIEDLRYVLITCQSDDCGAQLVLDMSRQFIPRPKREYFVPKLCPLCGEPFDTAVDALNELQNAFSKLWPLSKNHAGAIVFGADSQDD
jgi:hypothetical protein